MNAILGSVDNESLVSAHLQFEQLLMSMFMKSMNEHIQKAVAKSTATIEKRIVHKIASAIIGVIGDKGIKKPVKVKKPKLSPEELHSLRSRIASESNRTRWGNYTEEQRAEHSKIMSEANRKRWSNYTKEKRDSVVKSIREAQYKRWGRDSSKKMQDSMKKVRIFELPAEEQKRYTTIADSRRIAKTFVIRECKCLSEANHLIGRYLRQHDIANGYRNVRSAYGLHAMYDRRSVNWLCRGYANKTLSTEMLNALSYYFE